MVNLTATAQAWSLLDDGPRSGSENMAIDEVLLARAAQSAGHPILRLYTWDPPAVSLGRFQRRDSSVREEACRELGIEIVRRVTGGRAVLHDRELTYSIVSPSSNPLFPSDLLGTYRVIASGLLRGLAHLGIHAEMVSRTCGNRALVKARDAAPSCFSSPSWYEITVKGKKIIGSAQRRLPHAFLQHGSILIGHDAAREAAVIPGGSGGRVTCIADELGRAVTVEEVRTAFLAGFRDSLNIDLQKES